MLNHICHRATGAVISQRLSYSLNSNLITPKVVSLRVRSPQIYLRQTWNGVKTRKSRRVILILVFYVHIAVHIANMKIQIAATSKPLIGWG